MPITNPIIPQGNLNRLRASIVFPSNASLNVTAPFLTRMGIRLALDGDTTLYIPTMTGAITSPEPFQMATITVHLNKANQLSALYKAQMELQSTIGDCTIFPDNNSLTVYSINNVSIQSLRELDFSGQEGDFAIALRGYYFLNASLWA